MNDYLVIGIIAAVVIVAAYNIIKVLTIRRKGVETEGVISRITEHSSVDGDGSLDVTYTYYVVFRTQDGQEVEADLNHAPGRTRVGDRVRIKYLPEKPKHAVLIKTNKLTGRK